MRDRERVDTPAARLAATCIRLTGAEVRCALATRQVGRYQKRYSVSCSESRTNSDSPIPLSLRPRSPGLLSIGAVLSSGSISSALAVVIFAPIYVALAKSSPLTKLPSCQPLLQPSTTFATPQTPTIKRGNGIQIFARVQTRRCWWRWCGKVMPDYTAYSEPLRR